MQCPSLCARGWIRFLVSLLSVGQGVQRACKRPILGAHATGDGASPAPATVRRSPPAPATSHPNNPTNNPLVLMTLLAMVPGSPLPKKGMTRKTSDNSTSNWREVLLPSCARPTPMLRPLRGGCGGPFRQVSAETLPTALPHRGHPIKTLGVLRASGPNVHDCISGRLAQTQVRCPSRVMPRLVGPHVRVGVTSGPTD